MTNDGMTNECQSSNDQNISCFAIRHFLRHWAIFH
jgi:hypothetical protein